MVKCGNKKEKETYEGEHLKGNKIKHIYIYIFIHSLLTFFSPAAPHQLQHLPLSNPYSSFLKNQSLQQVF